MVELHDFVTGMQFVDIGSQPEILVGDSVYVVRRQADGRLVVADVDTGMVIDCDCPLGDGIDKGNALCESRKCETPAQLRIADPSPGDFTHSWFHFMNGQWGHVVSFNAYTMPYMKLICGGSACCGALSMSGDNAIGGL